MQYCTCTASCRSLQSNIRVYRPAFRSLKKAQKSSDRLAVGSVFDASQKLANDICGFTSQKLRSNRNHLPPRLIFSLASCPACAWRIRAVALPVTERSEYLQYSYALVSRRTHIASGLVSESDCLPPSPQRLRFGSSFGLWA